MLAIGMLSRLPFVVFHMPFAMWQDQVQDHSTNMPLEQS